VGTVLDPGHSLGTDRGHCGRRCVQLQADRWVCHRGDDAERRRFTLSPEGILIQNGRGPGAPPPVSEPAAPGRRGATARARGRAGRPVHWSTCDRLRAPPCLLSSWPAPCRGARRRRPSRTPPAKRGPSAMLSAPRNATAVASASSLAGALRAVP